MNYQQSYAPGVVRQNGDHGRMCAWMVRQPARDRLVDWAAFRLPKNGARVAGAVETELLPDKKGVGVRE